MRSLLLFGVCFIALGCTSTQTPGATPPRILFIGNSFTFAQGSAVRYFHPEAVTDLNRTAQGGMPALFKVFAAQAGLQYDVALETEPGSGLEFHLENRRERLARPWDLVVMHGQSTLDFAQPGDDHYHASAFGSYLEALVVFGAVTGRDPRSLGVGECAGFELGFSQQQVQDLQQVAAEQLLADSFLAPRDVPVSNVAAPRPCA